MAVGQGGNELGKTKAGMYKKDKQTYFKTKEKQTKNQTVSPIPLGNDLLLYQI